MTSARQTFGFAVVSVSLACAAEPNRAATSQRSAPLAVVSATPDAAAPTREPSAPAHAIVLGGANTIENAVWARDTIAAVTHASLWRFRAEDPDTVHMVPLSSPLGSSAVLGVATRASLVAVGLESGGVDIFRADARALTIAPDGDATVLDLRFSPDARTIAVTRTGSTSWIESTTLYDVATGAARSNVRGSAVIFDATGSLVATRGGVYAVDDGREIAPWPEGFYVRRANGSRVDINTVPLGEEVLAGDDVPRGFFAGFAFYGSEKRVALIDNETGKITSIDAKCSSGPKLANIADAPHARVIGLCADSALVTDLAKQTTQRLAFPARAGAQATLTAHIALLPSVSFLVDASYSSLVVVDPASGTTRAATWEDAAAFREFDQRAMCTRSPPRADIPCTTPSRRDDGAFQIAIQEGLTVLDTRSEKSVLEWSTESLVERSGLSNQSTEDREELSVELASHEGGIDARTSKGRHLRYRFGPARSQTSEPFPPTVACGTLAQWVEESNDTFSLYRSVGGNPLTLCRCDAHGCKSRPETPLVYFLSTSLGGAWLYESTNSTMTETTLRLERPGATAARSKIGASCIRGTFDASERPVLTCEANNRNALYLLAPADLSVITRRRVPDSHVDEIVRADNDILAIHRAFAGSVVSVLPPEWFAPGSTSPPRATIYALPTFGIRDVEGRIEIVGDEEAAARAIRCYDGTRFRPFSTCRDAVLPQAGAMQATQ